MGVAREATNGDTLVAIGAWESDPMHKHWPDYPEVAGQLREHLSSSAAASGLPPLKVFYACGADHANKCNLYSGLGRAGCGVVVVPRAGERVEKEQPSKLVYVAEACAAVSSFSSTAVRKAIKAKDYDTVSTAMSPEAAQMLLEPSEQDLARFANDYKKLGTQ